MQQHRSAIAAYVKSLSTIQRSVSYRSTSACGSLVNAKAFGAPRQEGDVEVRSLPPMIAEF